MQYYDEVFHNISDYAVIFKELDPEALGKLKNTKELITEL
jgi:hypothetical protein